MSSNSEQESGSVAGSVTGSVAGSDDTRGLDTDDAKRPSNSNVVDPRKIAALRPQPEELKCENDKINKLASVLNMIELLKKLTTDQFIDALEEILRSASLSIRENAISLFEIAMKTSNSRRNFERFITNCIYFMLVNKTDEIGDFISCYIEQRKGRGDEHAYFNTVVQSGVAYIRLIMYEVYTQYISRIVSDKDMRDFVVMYYKDTHDVNNYCQESITYPETKPHRLEFSLRWCQENPNSRPEWF